jgi:hypothetical protein
MRTGGASAFEPTPLPGRDPGLGHIFRNMRSAMRLPREAIARRLATTPGTIEDLEAGAVSSLPHWRETSRIVRGYCELLRLDPEPLLWRIQRELKALGGHEEPQTRPGGTTQPPRPPPALLRSGRSRRRPDAPRKVRRRARTLFAIGAPVGVLAGILYAAFSAPEPIYRAITLLPAPLEGPARAGMDSLLLLSAPRREGLRWIDIGDPQLRKVDKLQTTAR